MSAPHYVAAAGWLTGWVLLTRVPRLPPLPDPAAESDGGLTVVIPARNEAETLPLSWMARTWNLTPGKALD